MQFQRTLDSINATIRERDRILLRDDGVNQNTESRLNTNQLGNEILPQTPTVGNSTARDDCFIAPALRRKNEDPAQDANVK